MNWTDLSILAVIVLSASLSLLEGFVREALSLLAWLLSLGSTLAFVNGLERLLIGFIPFVDLRLCIALISLFVSTLFVLSLVNYLIIRSIEPIRLTRWERALGIPLGAARGAILIVLLVLLAGLSQIPAMNGWQQSQYVNYFEQIAIVLRHQLPAEIAVQFNFNPPPKSRRLSL